MRLGEQIGLQPSKQELRDAFGDALLEACRNNPKIVVLDGDLGNSTRANYVREELPGRFFNIGIAESNLVSIAAGFAACGYIPFVSSFPSFLFCNAYDQVRLSISIPSLNVKFVGSHAGISTGREGPSPMSIEDFALVGSFPPFVIVAPSDPFSMREAVFAAIAHVGPVYIRSSRMSFPNIYPAHNSPFEIGKANIPRQGRDLTIIACGMMVSVALDASALLADEGVEVRVLDMHTVKPLDEDAIVQAARETGAIVTAEEHLIRGGLGSGVAQVVATTWPVPMRFVGLDNTYTESGSVEELMNKYRLTAKDIATAAIEVYKMKHRSQRCYTRS
jgi:transketolase